jgi:Carbohydrate binding module (family 6)
MSRLLKIFSLLSFLFLLVPHSTSFAIDGGPKPFGGQRSIIPGKIEAEHFDLGPAHVAYFDVEEKNQGANYREPTQVDIEKRDDASNGHGIGWTKKGEWLCYSVTIKQSGKYSLAVPVASNKPGGKFHLELDGKDVTGPIVVPDTGGWDKLKVIEKKDIELPQGDHLLKILMDEEGQSTSIGDIDCLTFTLQPAT